ncbi:hypothetical protein, partial [Treponema phagedenis]|uniref:hypothetical protein n=1 Tax=Treponema phagedenis TaxID=162 RepID=UPI001C066B26
VIKKTVKTTYYEIQIESRKIFEAALARIRQYKKNLDIELSNMTFLTRGLSEKNKPVLPQP